MLNCKFIVIFLTYYVCYGIATNCEDTYDVLVLGAGMAGVSAARTLTKNGITNFAIIEGTDRAGGRAKQAYMGDYTVELGAMWVHGGKGNPMYDLALKYNLSIKEADYDNWKVYDDNGTDVTEEGNAAYEIYGAAYEYVTTYREGFREDVYARSDISVESGFKLGGWLPKTPVEQVSDYFSNDFDYGLPPASMRHPGTETHEHFEEKDLTVYQQGKWGYSLIPHSMLENDVKDWKNKTYFNTVVESIEYNSDRVNITTTQGLFSAKYVIVTFSIGVLQNNAVTFKPQLPLWKREAIYGFQMANYKHFYMQFPSIQPWFVPDNTEWIAFASINRGYYPIWLNMEVYLPGSRLLQCTVTNEEAYRLDFLSDAEILQEAMVVLRKMFGPAIPDATKIVVPMWQTDPFNYGSFCNWPLGYTKSTHDSLKAPVGRVYFAGEAYVAEYYAYLHGALLSGEENVKNIMKCMDNPNNCQQHVPDYLSKGCTYQNAKNVNQAAKIDDGSCIIWAQPPTSRASHSNSAFQYISVLMISFIIYSYI